MHRHASWPADGVELLRELSAACRPRRMPPVTNEADAHRARLYLHRAEDALDLAVVNLRGAELTAPVREELAGIVVAVLQKAQSLRDILHDAGHQAAHLRALIARGRRAV